MATITLIFTIRKYNLISLLIRWAVPVSRFRLSCSSHVLIVDGEGYLEAHMLGGVRRTDNLDGLTVVKVVTHSVPDAAAGIAWARSQIGRPYDWWGALGLSFSPFRNWQDPAKWFCYEFAAMILKRAGKDCFADIPHVTESILLSVKP